MSDAPLTCPYCNAFVAVPAAGAMTLDGRLACPRCSEIFTPSPGSYAGQPSSTGPRPEAVVGDMPVSMGEKPRGRNRLVGLALLGLMVVMAGTSLTYALLTTGLRRAHDSGPSQKGGRLPIPTDATTMPETGPVAPAKLDAVAYLPPDTSLIIGVHLAEIEANKSGSEAVLDQPFLLGPVRVSIDKLLGFTGFSRAEVQHFVIGVKLDDPLPPRVELILHTKAPHDADAARKKVKAVRDSTDGGRRIDTFPLGDTQFSPALWCADDRHTFVFGLVPSDVKAALPRPRRDLGQLPREIRETLQDRVASGGPLWIVATADDWNKTLAADLLTKMKPEDRDRLKRVHAFAAWVQLDQGVTVRGAFDCRDDKDAQALDDYFQKLGKADNPDLKTAVLEGWLTLQWKTKVEAILKALEK